LKSNVVLAENENFVYNQPNFIDFYKSPSYVMQNFNGRGVFHPESILEL